MDSAEMKKRIIKETITPFFKNNGFAKKGVKYFRVADNLIVEAEIQSQRYYTEENVKNFRINISIYPEVELNLPYPSVSFGCHSVMSESSWIAIDENTSFEEMNAELETELDKTLSYIEKNYSLKEMTARAEKDIENLEKIIHETKFELENESSNQNLIYVLKNEIKKAEVKIDILNDWLKVVRGTSHAQYGNLIRFY